MEGDQSRAPEARSCFTKLAGWGGFTERNRAPHNNLLQVAYRLLACSSEQAFFCCFSIVLLVGRFFVSNGREKITNS